MLGFTCYFDISLIKSHPNKAAGEAVKLEGEESDLHPPEVTLADRDK